MIIRHWFAAGLRGLGIITWVFCVFAIQRTRCQSRTLIASNSDYNVTVIPDLFYCPKDWFLLDWMCYRYYDGKMSWAMAALACDRVGGSLVVIPNVLKNNGISSISRRSRSPGLTSQVWIGLSNLNLKKEDKQLQWVDKTEIGPYSGSWSIGEPDLKSGDCAAIDPALDTDNWHLQACETLLPFMCQIPACPKNTFTCMGESKCIEKTKVCDGNFDCGSRSDEFDCSVPKVCAFYLTGSSGGLGSPNHPRNYPSNSSCSWLIEGPAGSVIELQFGEFVTEDGKDIVTVLGGSLLPAKTRALATLSGQPTENLRLRSDNNFMIVKFSSDLSVDMPGFSAVWKAISVECGGNLEATESFQVAKIVASPAEPLGVVECVYRIAATQGDILTVEVLEIQLGSTGDNFVYIRNGNSANSPLLGIVNGQTEKNNTVFQSTSNQLYLYVRLNGNSERTALSFRYAAVCDLELINNTGIIKTPGFNLATAYPRNLACSWRIKPNNQRGRPFVIQVTRLVLEAMDELEIYEIDASVTKTLFSNQNFSGASFTVHVQSGDALIKLVAGPLGETSGFLASYSLDCPPLTKGDLVMLSNDARSLGAEVTVSCPAGYELDSQDLSVVVKCGLGGVWSLPRIPHCQPKYCGPAPRFLNARPVNVTSFSFQGTAEYQCLGGYVLDTGAPSTVMYCSADGSWTGTVVCQPIKCSEVLPKSSGVTHLRATVAVGNGFDFGSVINFDCDPGFTRIGPPAVFCLPNTSWSDAPARCERHRCSSLPTISHGFIYDKQQDQFSFGDTMSVGCLPGYRLVGPSEMICGIDGEFGDAPTCEDTDECQDEKTCDSVSTTCTNVLGDHFCQCKPGFTGTPECKQSVMLDVGVFKPERYGITASGSVAGFGVDQIGLSSKGWCGDAYKPSENWVEIDLRAPKVISAVRILPVVGGVRSLASVKTFTISYKSLDGDSFTTYSEPNGDPLSFPALMNSTAGTHLPAPIEAQIVRITIQDFYVNPCMRLDFIGCWKQSCFDINECSNSNGKCDQLCHNIPGSFECGCDDGFQLYAANGTSSFFLPHSENGLREGDEILLNQTCVPQSCLPLMPPLNGVLLSTQTVFRFGDEASFGCKFGFEMIGAPVLKCGSEGKWSNSQPLCIPAQCGNFDDDPSRGVWVEPKADAVPLGRNVTVSCKAPEFRLPGTAAARIRKCVFDRRMADRSYWLTGGQPSCEVVDCGRPTILPGSFYSGLSKTTYSSSFRFACVSPFSLSGESSSHDDVVRCTKQGIWDMGSLRCDGPTCTDPGRPADGAQNSTSYEESALVTFSCTKPGYALTDSSPLMCLRQADCAQIQPVGLSLGTIPEGAFKPTSELPGYEVGNVRLGSSSGWCAQPDNTTYVQMDLGRIFRITSMRLKGVVTNLVAGRVTQFRLFTKLSEDSSFAPVRPDFTATPGSYGALTTIPMENSIRARLVAIGVLGFIGYPCLKLEFYGCPAENDDKAVVGWNASVPACVDVEPPKFTNCPDKPVLVRKSSNGKLQPVMYDVPVAADNSGGIARMEVRPADFAPGGTVLDDMMVEYTAFDFDGNNATCFLQIQVVGDTPPVITCPRSYNFTMESSSEFAFSHFDSTSHPVEITGNNHIIQAAYSPERAKISPNSYVNVTVAVGDASNNTASCSFEVFVLPFPCSSAGSLAPDNGYNECRNEKDGKVVCAMSCSTGYQFVPGSSTEFVCDPKSGWSPSQRVPDCVPTGGHDAVYDAAIRILYVTPSPPTTDCLLHYADFLRTQQLPIEEMLSAKCSKTIDVPIAVSSLSVSMVPSNTSALAIQGILKYRVTPSRFAPRLFELCGLTVDTIFDMSVPATDPQIQAVAKLSDPSGNCPNLEATDAHSERGFTCVGGQVLIKNATRMVCLDCPRGFFAADSSVCNNCPPGSYQDEQGKAGCRLCPGGTFSPTPGSTSVDSCLPTCGSGTFSPNGVVPCLQCPKDTYGQGAVPGGAQSCTVCPPKTFTVTSGTKTVDDCRSQCAPGEYSPTGLAPCTGCPQNFVSLTTRAPVCDECPQSSYTLEENSTVCSEVICPVDLCINGGRCEVANHRAVCRCLPGFSGAQCEKDVDECASQPCFNGGDCVDGKNGYQCVCPAGYSGLQCETDPKDCASVTCPNRGMCQNVPGKQIYRCLCRKGFTGAFCNDTLDPCANSACINGGSCVRLQLDRFFCGCRLGYNGTYCENNIDDCVDNPCANGGTCTDLVHDFRCDCSPPFSGRYCESKLDLCGQLNCNNGFCYEELGLDVDVPTGRCVCNPGWHGSDCSVMIDNCAGEPCQNNGTCLNALDSYQCDCPQEFTGARCQLSKDNCEGISCQNGGKCVSGKANFRCDCPAGTEGTLCEQNIDDCNPFPCHPNNTDRCVDLIGDFSCICKAGFNGAQCENTPSGCSTHHCLNNGTCVDLTDGYRCDCPTGWKGPQCETRQTACGPNPCKNGGGCFDVFYGGQATVFCQCPAGFYGARCEAYTDPCYGSPCMNGGTCNNSSLSAGSCDCTADFFGPGCAYEVDKCAAGVCHNGATCEDLPLGYKCTCPEGFAGDNCDQREDLCRSASCPASSKCLTTPRGVFCKCPVSFTGEDCQKLINPDFDFLFYDDTKLSSASSIAPFTLITSALSLGVWVKFAVPGDTGSVLQLSGGPDDARFEGSNMPLLQLDHDGLTMTLFPKNSRIILPFTTNLKINDGNWHHVIFTWTSTDGSWNVTIDSIRLDGGTEYGKGLQLVDYGSVTLGARLTKNEAVTPRKSGLLGKISQVRLWDRVLGFRTEIPQLQDCSASVMDGLLYQMADVEISNGKVDFARPSNCFRPMWNKAKTSRVAAAPLVCPATRHVLAAQGLANVSWTLPGNNRKLSALATNIPSGSVLPVGDTAVSFVQYTPETPQVCHFDLVVHSRPCPDLEPPLNGFLDCSNYGPDDLFRRCMLQCNPSFEFSENVPDFFSCEADGQWHPSYSSTLLRFPACSPVIQPQRIVTLTVYYPAITCSDQTKQFLQDNIQNKVRQLNLDWPVCIASGCPGLRVSSSCQGRRKRDNDETGVTFNTSFPASTDPVRKVATKQQATVRAVLESLVFGNRQMDFSDQLPNASPSLRYTSIADAPICPSGNVLKKGKCIPCSVGTFLDGDQCRRCQTGFYQDEPAQLACKQCLTSTGKPAITITTGSVSPSECKDICSPGLYFNSTENRCSPCGYSSFQPLPGQFSCMRCPAGTTTLSTTSVDRSFCILECGHGEEIANSSGLISCRQCWRGFYRSRGQGPSCLACPTGFSTRYNGSDSNGDCSVPVCGPGSFFDQLSNVCVICPFGFYQHLPEQTSCLQCPEDTTTVRYGATSIDRCVSTNKCVNGEVTCHENAHCFKNGDGFKCVCKTGYRGDGMEVCDDMCTGYCFNSGRCTKDSRGNPVCDCSSTYYGERCQSKSETAYIAGGVAGAVLLLILIVLLIWMICVRTRNHSAPQPPPKVSPYAALSGGSSNGMLYAIEYPPSCSTTATVRSQAYVPYFDSDDAWEMSGYTNNAFVTDGRSPSVMDKTSILSRKTAGKPEPKSAYDVVQQRQRMQMKEVVTLEPPMDFSPKGGSDDERSARL